MHPTIHLCLVSAQPTPNLTPALDPGFKPRQAILLVSPDMAGQAGWLEAVLKPAGVQVSRYPIDDAWDLPGIRDRVLEILAEHEGEEIALNATGGTKLMSLAAYEAFRAAEKPVFYVHPNRDRLFWIYAPEPLPPPRDLADQVKLPQFLQAHGAKVVGRREFGVPDSLRALTDALIADADKYARPMTSLNWYAQQAEKSLRTEKPVTNGSPEFMELADLFERAGLLRWQAGRLVFPDENARFLVNGGWLEHYVLKTCQPLKSARKLQDIACNLEVERQQKSGAVRNELDVALLANNRLYVIECKTRRFDREPVNGAGAETLYKLDALTDILGGLKAAAMLVSYQPLPETVQQRAGDMKIEFCFGAKLANLEAHLRKWIRLDDTQLSQNPKT